MFPRYTAAVNDKIFLPLFVVPDSVPDAVGNQLQKPHVIQQLRSPAVKPSGEGEALNFLILNSDQWRL